VSKITIRDIAARVGVSKTTISFAFNDPTRISKETYRRVMAIVDELGYVPDPIARTLATKRMGALGLLLPQPIQEALANPYLCELIRGIGEVCEERSLALTMLPPVGGRIVEAARRAAVDAILTVGVGPGTQVSDLLHRRHMPFVTLDGAESETTVNVGIDDEGAAYALMCHVLGLGHRRIAILALQPDSYADPEERFSLVRDRRLAGFARALGEAGLSVESPGIRVLPVVGSLEGGLSAGLDLLRNKAGRPSAVVAMSDAAALGVYEACKELAISIPGQLSVAGFDDIPLAARADPPLTTVRQPGREKGARAASLALALLEGGGGGHLRLQAELVARASTAMPAAGRG
jgi:alanine racemase